MYMFSYLFAFMFAYCTKLSIFSKHVHLFVAIIPAPALALKTNTEVYSVWLILLSPIEGDSHCEVYSFGSE